MGLMESRKILGMRVDAVSYESVVVKILEWTRKYEGKYICVANVHMSMEAFDKPDFQKIVNQSDLVTPDGMPLVWMLRLLGIKNASRVRGPTLMPCILSTVNKEQENYNIGFYGSKDEVLDKLVNKIKEKYTSVNVVYVCSPPFRPLTLEEDEKVINEINDSKVDILFVGLGCPKQEKWMADHKGKINAVMIGVGAAFDMYAGFIPECPKYLQSLGLEWLFRLYSEPRRLWKRYLNHNPRFVVLSILQLLSRSKGQEVLK